MKIACLPRTYFKDIRGSSLEAELLEANKVVSIQSASGWDSEPPFSPESLSSPHLLRLMFDDCYGESRKIRSSVRISRSSRTRWPIRSSAS